MTRVWRAIALAGMGLGWVGSAAAQDSAWIHVSVETRGATGEQVSTFRAFTTSDQAGSQRIPVTRLCVKGIAHRVEERCVDNADSVELVERATGLPGMGNLCVEAVASAESKVGPLSATARACP
ncbi:MAG: hypothetical protein ACREJR_11625 [Candidatus Rokuibacteriota bacterium]